jgi:hypothetical protein
MLPLLRWYASGIDVMDVFDRNTKRLQRNRAAIASDAHIYDYLKDEVASRMVDRVCDVARFFPAALDVGCGRGHIAKEMNSDIVGTLYQCDMAENMVVCILLIFYLFYIFIHTRVLPFLSACVGYFN